MLVLVDLKQVKHPSYPNACQNSASGLRSKFVKYCCKTVHALKLLCVAIICG
eukprot:m.8218 g.8218  ORF g.8218 m.8218 type:complete len:52 (+) comp5334_c0_seq1:457-612(+)